MPPTASIGNRTIRSKKQAATTRTTAQATERGPKFVKRAMIQRPRSAPPQAKMSTNA